jgi:hypothetical protein
MYWAKIAKLGRRATIGGFLGSFAFMISNLV